MIDVDDIAREVRRLGLDAEDTDYYDNEIDMATAISAAARWVVHVATYNAGETRYKGEALNELRKARVFITDKRSRIQLPTDIWSLDAVAPLPELESPDPITGNGGASSEAEGQIHVDVNDTATRLTIEEWAKNKNNSYAAGNVIQTESCSEDKWKFGYLEPYFYGGQNVQRSSIEIRPFIPKRYVTLFVVNNPEQPIYTGSAFSPTQLSFDLRLRSLIVDKALNFISRKQGDNTTLYQVTQADIQLLSSIL